MSGSEGVRLLELANWRAITAGLYAAIRRQPENQAQAAWEEFRRARAAMFRTHPQSPLGPEQRAGFHEMRCFPYDPSWNFRVPVSALAEGVEAARRTVELEEGRFGYRPFATVTFTPAGVPAATLTLYWIEGYGGGLFLPFRDRTNGVETYGGGRYLYDTIKGADLGAGQGEIRLDFNFAYNPSCAYGPQWLCPLSPPENSLPFRVAAGELAFPEASAP